MSQQAEDREQNRRTHRHSGMGCGAATEAATPETEGTGSGRRADGLKRGGKIGQRAALPHSLGRGASCRIDPAHLARLCLTEAVAEDVLQAGTVGGGRNGRQGSGLPAASTGTLSTGCSAALRVRVRCLTQATEQWWASSRTMKTWVNMQKAVRRLGTLSSISSCTWKRPKLPMSAATWAKGATVTAYRLLSWGHQTALQLALGHGLLGAVAVLR